MLEKIARRYRRWRAKRRLITRYLNEIEVERILEKWVQKRILDGQKGRREELIKKRQRVEEMELLIEFLREI